MNRIFPQRDDGNHFDDRGDCPFPPNDLSKILDKLLHLPPKEMRLTFPGGIH